MKKASRKILSLLLVVAVIMSFSIAPAFAQSSRSNPKPDQPSYTYYVPMGTSITGGYGIKGDTKIVYGFGEGTYGSLVADYYNIPEKNRYDGALLGTRTHEFRVLLEDDFHGDEFTEGWSEEKCGNGEESLKKQSTKYKEALTKADLITIELGSNDIFSHVIYYTLEDVKALAEAEEDPETKAEMEDFVDSLEGKGTGAAMAGLMAIATAMGDESSLYESMMSRVEEGIEDFKTNFDAIIGDIRALNSTADIVVLGVYNPMEYLVNNDITNNQNGSQTLKDLILGAGELFGSESGSALSDAFVASVSKKLTDLVIYQVNAHMQSQSSYVNEYIFEDTSNIDLTGSGDGTHPGYIGHAYLAEHVETAIDGLYDCQHKHKMTTGASVPTSSSSGKTGQIVCADCGEVLQESKTLTYDEYLSQQKFGTVADEEEPEDEEEEIVYPEDANVTYPEADYQVLGFTSDVHNLQNNKAASRLSKWIVKAQQHEGKFDFLGILGDLGKGDNDNFKGEDYWDTAKPVIDIVNHSGIVKHAITTGNHELKNGQFATTTNVMALTNIIQTGEASVPNDANYKIYCFGAKTYSYESGDEKYTFDQEDIDALSNYLKTVDKSTPVFIMSHYPLHKHSKRDIENREKVIEVLNNYPNVIFLWGHNHSDAYSSEKNYDKVYQFAIDGSDINFTYASAGCMSDSEYGYGSGAVDGKGLVATVTEGKNPEVTLVYTDANGQMVTSPVEVDVTGAQNVSAKAISGTYEFTQADSIEDGGQYVIVGDNGIALDTNHEYGYENGDGSTYNGIKGRSVTAAEGKLTGGVYDDMVWKFVKTGTNKYKIVNVVSGRYLNAVESDSENVYVNNTQDVWTLSEGTLKSENSNGRKLCYGITSSETLESGNADMYTTHGSGTTFTFYKVNEGTVKEYTAPTKKVEALSVASGLQDGHKYVIASEGYALTSGTHSGYTNTSDYTYTGLAGKKTKEAVRKLASYVYKDMVFECQATDGGFLLYNTYAKKYLSATYYSKSSDTRNKGGDLILSSNKDVWSLKGGKLYNNNTEKYLMNAVNDTDYKIAEGSTDLFTIRSSGTGISLYEITDSVKLHDLTDVEPSTLENMKQADAPKAGEAFIISANNRALTTVKNSGYTRTTGETYSGLNGKTLSFTDSAVKQSEVKQNMVWVFESAGTNKYKIRNYYTGEYLSSSYQSKSSGSRYSRTYYGIGSLFTGDDETVWTYSNGKLTNGSASITYKSKSDISTPYEGHANFFTASDSGSDLVLYYVEKPSTITVPSYEDMFTDCCRWELCEIGEGTAVVVTNGYALGIENGRITTKGVYDLTKVSEMSDAYKWVINEGKTEGTYSLQNVASKTYLSAYINSNIENYITGTDDISVLLNVLYNKTYNIKVGASVSTQPYYWSYDNINDHGLYTTVKSQEIFDAIELALTLASNTELAEELNTYKDELLSYFKSTTDYYLVCNSGIVSVSDTKVDQVSKILRAIDGGEHHVVKTTLTDGVSCDDIGDIVYACEYCGQSYTISGEGINHDWGKGTVTKTAKNNKAGTITYTCLRDGCNDTKTEEIPAVKSVVLKTTEYTYDGDAKKPAVSKVVLSDGSTLLTSNYSVSYSDNVNAGEGTVTINLKGGLYEGSVAQKFTISPAVQKVTGTSSYSKVYKDSEFTLDTKAKTDLTFESSDESVATVDAASGKVTLNGVGTCTITATAALGNYKQATKTIKVTVKPKKSYITKVTVGKKKMTVKLDYSVGSRGAKTYQIAYRVAGTDTWKKVTTSNKSYTIKKLKKGKKYQVKVRAYKKVSGTTYYGAWSAVKKTAKIK